MKVMKGQESWYNLPRVWNKVNELGLKVRQTRWACQRVMIDISFELVSVLGLTFVIKARSGLKDAF
jgi:hypothetical protein